MNIQAIIVADSKNKFGDRITTFLVTFPRYLLAELNTHRMFSRNSASSRAIPFKKMVESIKTTPFVPEYFMKNHSGMQGSEYETSPIMIDSYKKQWLEARDHALKSATSLNNCDLTKQMCNRLLEPFMYHTALITATEYENFFELRCPQYEYYPHSHIEKGETDIFRSWKDLVQYVMNVRKANRDVIEQLEDTPLLDRLKANRGQAEIHLMALAECMWDAYNESTPKELKEGEWHIPFRDKILSGESVHPFDHEENYINNNAIKISTGMCARTSYTVVGDEKEITYDKLIGIHDKMLTQKPFHASPFEHCARCMSELEYKCLLEITSNDDVLNGKLSPLSGRSRNFKGFKQYREIIENIK